jgi:hypothetical protein
MPDNQKNPVIMGNQMLSKAKSCQAHRTKKGMS